MIDLAHVFPDTNVFLHFPALDGLDWCNLCRSKKVVLHITQAFIAELNKAKDAGGSPGVRKRAKSVQRRLKAIHVGEEAKLPAGVTVVFSATSPDLSAFPELNPHVADDALLSEVLLFKETDCGGDVFVATDDDGFGLRVKCGSHGIQIVEPPDESRLKPEPDENEVELRRLRKEVEILRNAMPKLAVHFVGGANQLRFSIEKPDIDAELQDFMRKLCDAYPELRVADKPKGFLATVTREAVLFTPEKVAAYNRELAPFFAQSEEAARSLFEIRARTIFFTLATRNSGSAPANDLSIRLHFPDGFTLRKKEAWDAFWRKRPQPPEKPTSPFDRISSLATIGHPARGLHLEAMRSSGQPLPSLSIRKINSYEMHFAHPKLKHAQEAELGEFALTFDDAPFSFEVEYEALADNLPDVLQGKLHFVAIVGAKT